MQAAVLDLRECSEFRQAVEARPPRYLHATFALTLALLAGAVAWAAWAELELVTKAQGRVRSPSSRSHDLGEVSGAKLVASIAGRVAEVVRQEGAEVEAGEVIARLEAPRLQRQAERICQALETSRQQLLLLEGLRRKRPHAARVDLARLAEEEARLEERRLAQLVQRGVRPSVAGARATASRKAAEVAVHQAELALEVRDEELRIRLASKRGELLALKGQAQAVDEDLRGRVMRAPYAGVITRIVVQPGERVQPGQPLAILARQTDLHVDLRVRGVDVGGLEVGQTARIKLDALDHRKYGVATGRVAFISPDAPLDSAKGAGYLVRIALDQTTLRAGDERARIMLGMTGRAEIATGSERVLVLAWRRLRGACQD